MPINMDFVRVEGGDEGFFSNHSLFYNNLPLSFNTRALLRIAQTSSSQNLPAVGIIASQCGNKTFPRWEYIRCCSIAQADKPSGATKLLILHIYSLSEGRGKIEQLS